MLGNRINEAMRARGLNKVELAELSGLSQPMVTLITTGKTKDPGISKVVAISKALQVPIDLIVSDTPPDNELKDYIETHYEFIRLDK